jgi:hypothetical protein
MIRFVCECGKQLQAREENAGKQVRCPACQRLLTVPDLPPTAIQREEEVEPAAVETRVRKDRSAIREETEWEPEDRRRRREEPKGSGKAIATLVLGILSLCGCACLTGVPSIVLGILSLRDISRAAGVMTGKVMAIIGMVLGGLGTLCWPVVGIPAWFVIQDTRDRTIASNNIKQMVLAMHNYNDTYGKLPLSGVGNPVQPFAVPPKPLLSWRVALLPFLEQESLYRQFKVDEPWDGPNNSKLLAKMPKIYQLPGDDKMPAGHTCFQVFVGNGAAFEKTESMRFPASFPDGMSNTILIAVAAKGVPWTKPEDIPFDPNRPIAPLLGTHYRGGFLVGMADMTIRILPAKTPESTLKAMITRNAGDWVSWP